MFELLLPSAEKCTRRQKLVERGRGPSPCPVCCQDTASSSSPSHLAEVHPSHGGWARLCGYTAADSHTRTNAPFPGPGRHAAPCPQLTSSLTAFPPLSKSSLKTPVVLLTPALARGRAEMCCCSRPGCPSWKTAKHWDWSLPSPATQRGHQVGKNDVAGFPSEDTPSPLSAGGWKALGK